MKRRVVAVVLSLAMTASVLAGCAGGDKQADVQKNTAAESEEVAESTEAAEETAKDSETAEETVAEVEEAAELPVDYFAGTELNIVVYKDPLDTSTDETYGNKPALKLAEEATGIKINWTVVDAATAADKVSVMLAAGPDAQPDVYLGWGLISESVLAQNTDMFYNLAEEGLLETYAPNVLERYEVVDMLENLKWPDGSIYSLAVSAMVQAYTGWAMSTQVIRQDWLDQLGLEVPTTADEFYDVLVAFRDNDMNGNGDTTDEIPLTFCSDYWEGELMLLANSFGISGGTWQKTTHYKMLEDGQVIPVCAQDNFRAFLEYFHKLAEEGLLDMEGFSQTSEQYIAKIDEGRTGSYIRHSAYENETPFFYEGVEGVTPSWSGEQNRLSAQKIGFVATKNANIEAALHWWNYMHSSPELKYLAVRGEEGRLWYIDESGKIIADEAADPDYVYQVDAIHPHPCTYLEEYETLIEPGSRAEKRYKTTEKYVDYIPKKGFSQRFVSAEAVEERAFIEIELFDYINSFVATSISEGVTDASWEAHLEQLEAVGYYDWIQWYQDVEDGKF